MFCPSQALTRVVAGILHLLTKPVNGCFQPGHIAGIIVLQGLVFIFAEKTTDKVFVQSGFEAADLRQLRLIVLDLYFILFNQLPIDLFPVDTVQGLLQRDHIIDLCFQTFRHAGNQVVLF